jgi:uncharacterized protein with WD repeat
LSLKPPYKKRNTPIEFYQISVAYLPYNNQDCIAVSMSSSVKLYSLNSLEEIYTVIESINKLIEAIHISTCKRILVIKEGNSFSVWDTSNFTIVYTHRCCGEEVLHMTSDLMLFTYERKSVGSESFTKNLDGMDFQDRNSGNCLDIAIFNFLDSN